MVGLVTLQIIARPFGPFVLLTMSGCADTIAMFPLITVPLLLMTIGKTPTGTPFGTTKLIAVELTEYMPHATPTIETDTPFNSIGSDGANLDSDALPVAAVDGARPALELIRAN
jgi:hypothetical protein